jgi:hypothetical protein
LPIDFSFPISYNGVFGERSRLCPADPANYF